MDTLKKLVVIIIVLVGGYLVYEHFFYLPPQDDAAVEEATDYNEPSLPIPENCKALATNLENAIYGNDHGQVSFAQKNTAYRKLMSCLRAEGFSGEQIKREVGEIEERAKRD